MKKSFIIHVDSLDILGELTDEQAGVLFKAIWQHQVGNEVNLDATLKMVFIPFKNQFQRDLNKYTTTVKARQLAGSKGGIAKVANASKRSKTKQSVANVAVSDNDSVSDSVNDKDIKRGFDRFWNEYGKKVGDKNACIKKWLKLTDADMAEIFRTLPDFLKSITDKQFLPYPTTYLSQRRWENELEPTDTKPVKKELTEDDSWG